MGAIGWQGVEGWVRGEVIIFFFIKINLIIGSGVEARSE